jgi:N-methylhydantoinase A
MRYAGQGHELSVAWDGRNAGELLDAFHALHQQRYGHHDPLRAVELVTLRLRARIRREAPPRVALEPGGVDATQAKAGTRTVHLAQDEEVTLYARDRLRAGNVIDGPAIVEQVDSTTLVLRGWQAVVDQSGALVLTRGSYGH